MAIEPAEQQIFESCLALSLQQRASFIRQACAGNPDLGERIHRLLDAHDRAERCSLARLFDTLPEPPGLIGPYRLVQVIGEGGMGVVYEADQLYPVRRKVALKLVRWGMHSREIAARFEAERQALALMDHPSIARVLDAGSTQDGRPFFVMELVPGVALTTFCDRERLSIRQRLELFVLLTRAVQHAHQKGVVHRDLKPSNVLVARQDGQITLKVIDFGIAKAIGCWLGESTMVTQVGTALGTPAYMSPEQAEMSTFDIDTRADIYSLGVILYELVVGVLPVVPEELGLAAFLAQLGNREIEPALPSERFLGIGKHAGRVAADRQMTVSELVGELKGDLDWVIAKAIDKDRSRRYESADALATEIRRYLNHQTLQARPPTLMYRLNKFLRRNRPGFAAVCVALAALLAGVVGVVLGLLQAERSRQEALKQAERASEAEYDANMRLRHALVAQARALRSSRTMGRRSHSLRLLSQAAALGPGVDLRDEGIASVTLGDLDLVANWPKRDDGGVSVDFDDRFEQYAWGILGGDIEITRIDGVGIPRILPGFGSDPWVLSFSPDGRYLAVKYQPPDSIRKGCVRVWDTLSGSSLLELPVLPAGTAMDFSPDSRQLALISSHHELIFIDLKEKRERLRRRLGRSASSIVYRHDGAAVAVSTDDGAVVVYDTRGGAQINLLQHSGRAFRADWSRDGRLLVAGYSDGTAVVWDVRNGIALSTLKGHQAEVVRAKFHPRFPLVLTYSWDETTRFWEAYTGRQILSASAQALDFSSDGRFVSFVGGDSLGIWRLRYGETLHTYFGHQGKGPRSLDLTRDGKRFVSGGLDGLMLWDSRFEHPIGGIPTRGVREVFFDDNDQDIFSCGAEGLIRWTLVEKDGTVRVADRRILSNRPCDYAALGTGGSTVVSVHPGNEVLLQSSRGDSAPTRLTGFPGVAHLSLTERGQMVAAGNWRGDRTVIWNGKGGEIIQELLPGQTSVGVLFSPDGQWLATGSIDEYRLWSTQSWTSLMQVRRPTRFSHLPGLMAFDDSGEHLAMVIDSQTIGVYSQTLRRLLFTLKLQEPQGFSSIRFSGDGGRLAASTTANRIHIWNLSNIFRELTLSGLDFGLAEEWTGGPSSLPNPALTSGHGVIPGDEPDRRYELIQQGSRESLELSGTLPAP